MKKKWIPITAASAAAAGFGLTVDLMTRYAYDRKSPRYPKRLTNLILGNGKKHASSGSVRAQAEALRSKVERDVAITAYDGVRLVGHWIPCAQAKRVVILCHGWQSSCFYDYRTVAPFLHENGCSLLLTDMRAHGQSGGRYLYYGKKERFDAADWAKYVVTELAPGLPVYLMGMSQGSLAVLMATTAGLPKQVRGLIADSCAGSARELGVSTIRNMRLPAGLFYPCVRLDARLRTGMDDNEYTAYEAVSEGSVPILFIQGTADTVTEPEKMAALYDLCRSPKYRLLVEGAGHMKSCFVQPEAYQRAMLDFFENCDEIPEISGSDVDKTGKA